MSNTVPIAAATALQEAQALADYYRNRNLLLAQALAEARARIAALEADLAAAPAETEEADQ